MHRGLIRVCAIAGVTLSTIAAHAQSQPQLRSIGYLPGHPTTLIEGWITSLDGHTLATSQNGTMYRWRDGTWSALPAVPGLSPYLSYLSPDGNAIFATTSEDLHVLRGDNPQAWQTVQFDSSSYYQASASSSTRDAGIVYGRIRGRSNGYDYAARWTWNGSEYVGGRTEVGASETIGSFAVHENPFPSMWISPDGNVGISSLSGGNNTGWVGHWGVSGAPFVAPSGITPGAGFTYSAGRVAQSGDGRVLYARYTWENASSTPTNGSIVFRWDPVNGTTLLPFNGSSNPLIISNYTGSIMLYGGYWMYDYNTNITMSLPQYLTSLGADLTNWNVSSCLSISEDGRTLTGRGSYQFAPGQYRNDCWIVTVPTPASLSIAACSMLLLRRHRSRVTNPRLNRVSM